MGYVVNEYLNFALNLANKALRKGEVPIGAVIVRNNKIISTGYNMRERKQNALYHAEVIAINKACKKLKSWRLDDCDMYVTLEPCQMCMGAITNARIKTVYYGAPTTTTLNWETTRIDMQSPECSKILKDFFANMRKP